MTSYVTPKKNVALKFYIALVDQSNTKLTKANPTIASGDFKVSTDGGAFGNLTTLPSANPASGRAIMIDLSAGEMNGDNIVVQCVDAAGAEWCDLVLNIQTTARQIDDLAFPATTGRSMVVDASGLVDANMVKAGPTGSGTAQTAGDIPARLPAALTAGGNIKADALAWNGLATVALPLVPTTAGRTLDVTAANKVNGVVLVDTVTTYTGNTPQTADVATLITTVGAAGAGLTSVGLATTSRAGIRKNVALAKFEFLMTDSTNHNPSASLAVTVTRSIDGGAFAPGTLSAVTEIGVGIYSVDFGAGDLNGTVITLRATAAASDDLFVTIHTDP